MNVGRLQRTIPLLYWEARVLGGVYYGKLARLVQDRASSRDRLPTNQSIGRTDWDGQKENTLSPSRNGVGSTLLCFAR